MYYSSRITLIARAIQSVLHVHFNNDLDSVAWQMASDLDARWDEAVTKCGTDDPFEIGTEVAVFYLQVKARQN